MTSALSAICVFLITLFGISIGLKGAHGNPIPAKLMVVWAAAVTALLWLQGWI